MPHKLLLADDSVTIQRVIELTFAEEDVQVVAVSDGDHAIAQIAAEPPDIVLADVGMPGKSGYDVAAYIKQNPKLAHIPVVLLTGAFEPVDQNRAKAIGCDGVLAKPFEPQLVIGRVRELLKRPVAAPGAASVAAAPPLKPLAPANAPVPAPSPFAASPVAAAAAAPPAFDAALSVPPPAAGGNDQWAASLSAQAPAGASKDQGSVDTYFDRLDAAFATVSGSANTPQAGSVAEQIDWYGAKSPAPAAAESPSLSYASPQADFAPAAPAAPPAPAPVAAVAAVPAPAPIAAVVSAPAPSAVSAVATLPQPAPAASSVPEPFVTARGISLPPLADAFAAMLAAEQGAATDGPVWPASLQPQPVAVTDELVDRVAKRVLDQLSDHVVRETVSRVVADVAERLVHEEIERLKASIK